MSKRKRKNETSYVGAVGRPDTSGVRGKGAKRNFKTMSSADGYPYDSEMSYGQPAATNRANAGHGGSRTYELVPKDTEHTVYDEAMGTPVNQKMSQGNSGRHTGGRVMPGTSGRWSGGHTENDISDDELDQAVEELAEFMNVMPVRGASTRRRPPEEPSKRDKEEIPDDYLRFVDDEEEDRADVLTYHGSAQWQKGMGTGMKHSRAYPGYSFKEAVQYFDNLFEAYVSLSDMDDEELQDSMSVDDERFDSLKNEFDDFMSKNRVQNVGDEKEFLSLMLKIDPEGTKRNVSNHIKGMKADIYDQWIGELTGPEASCDEIEAVLDRAKKVMGSQLS